MIIVRVELHSAITGDTTELARMWIANRGDSTNHRMGNYDVSILRGRSKEALDQGTVLKTAGVEQHQRLAKHVWNLVCKALNNAGYR